MESHSSAQELSADWLEATLQVMQSIEQGSQVDPYRMPTPLSLGSTSSVDAGPQPISDNGGSPITFAHGWGIEDSENISPRCPGSAVGGLVLIQEDGGEIDQGMRRVMEDNHVKLILWATQSLGDLN
jgi:hypothetical protein